MRPPKWLWFLAAAIAFLRALPFAATFFLPAPEGMSFLHVGYMPEDMHAYLSFIHQASDEGTFFFENRFVTADQSGRFILLFHWLLGIFAAITKIPAVWVLELSRIPLVFLFFATVWWFLEPVFGQQSERRERLWAAAFIGVGGGIHSLLRMFARGIPEVIGKPFLSDTWHLYGWSTFESLYNPLWIAGLIAVLILLRPLLIAYSSTTRSHRPSTAFGPLAAARTLGLVLLFFLHPYSAAVVFAIAFTLPLTSLLIEGPLPKRRLLGEALVPVIAGVVVAVISGWQRHDRVFSASTSDFFGGLDLPVFWYPLTFAVLLGLALRGAAVWMESRHSYRAPIIAWVGVIVLLHTSNSINGYHFIPYLHIPLSLLAATAMPPLWDTLSKGRRVAKSALVIVLVALFAGPVAVTFESLTDLPRRNLMPREFIDAASELARLPPGRVLSPPQMGLLVPTSTSHSVWAGHWFLTPDYWPKAELYGQLIADPAREEELRGLVDAERIDYLIVPSQAADRLGEAFGDDLEQHRSLGGLHLLQIRR